MMTSLQAISPTIYKVYETTMIKSWQVRVV